MNSPLLRSLFDDEEDRRPQTISELNADIKGALERKFGSVWIEGEITNFFDASSGHWYFTLSDSDSQIKAVCFKGANWKIRFKPFNGLQVRVRGKVTVYEPRGEYQISVESLEPVGEGALKIAFEQIKLKLEKDKLFDDEFKRPLPYFPRRVGVVTSPNGAAFHDILNVLSRRTRTVSIVLIPTLVQGETAPESIRQAIIDANEFSASAGEKDKIDVLIVGRGGGSAEDLWAFNEEQLARTIFASEIPIISAVGHEIDFSIADFVADMRAPTPSAAAEIVAESEDKIEAEIRNQIQKMGQFIEYKFLHSQTRLRESMHSPVFAEFPQILRDRRYEIEDWQETIIESVAESFKTRVKDFENLKARLSPLKLASNLGGKKTRLAVLKQRNMSAFRKFVFLKDEKLKTRMASLDALSPLAVLSRGFSVTKNHQGEILRDAARVKEDDEVKIRLAKGNISARVLETDQK